MHAPSSSLSGFLRAARQTGWGSASPSADGAPERTASGWRSQTPRPPEGPSGRASAPSFRWGRSAARFLLRRQARLLSVLPFSAASGSPGAGHVSEKHRELRLRLSDAPPAPPALLHRDAPDPLMGTARVTGATASSALSKSRSGCHGPPPALSLMARLSSSRRERVPERFLGSGSSSNRDPLASHHHPGSPSWCGKGLDGAAGADRGPAGSGVGRTCVPEAAVPGAGLGAEFTARL